jgi:hypothetical protein
VEAQVKRGRYILALALLAAVLSAQLAVAGEGYEARARKPSFDRSTLSLSGVGSYVSQSFKAELRVTVCLTKKFGRRTFTVNCESASGRGRRVKAQVSVPGCVRGTWRTTTSGEALNRRGDVVDRSSTASRKFSC